MNGNKVYNMYEFDQRVDSVYSSAKLFHKSSEEIREYIHNNITQEVLSVTPKGRKRYSAWMRGYVAGLVAMCNKEMYNHVEFCYEVDGVLFSTSKDSNRRTTEEFYTSNRGHELLDKQGYFYYKDADVKYHLQRCRP